LKPGAKYTLRTNYFALKGTDSSGDIFLMNVGDLQPLYTEGPDPAMPPLRWWEGTITTAPSTLEWNVTQRTVCSGEYAATFDYMSGAHALVIDKVELLRNGTVIATDEHRGQTGASDTNNIYRLSLPSYATDADYVLRASVHGSGGGHTFGIVHWTCDSDSRTKNQDGK